MTSKLPWKAEPYSPSTKKITSFTDRLISTQTLSDDADFIVQACNSYEADKKRIELLEAKLDIAVEALKWAKDDTCCHDVETGKLTGCVICKALESVNPTA